MIIKLFKNSIVVILFTAALFLLFCEPLDDSRSWMSDFFLSKAISFALGYFAVRLMLCWNPISEKEYS